MDSRFVDHRTHREQQQHRALHDSGDEHLWSKANARSMVLVWSPAVDIVTVQRGVMACRVPGSARGHEDQGVAHELHDVPNGVQHLAAEGFHGAGHSGG